MGRSRSSIDSWVHKDHFHKSISPESRSGGEPGNEGGSVRGQPQWRSLGLGLCWTRMPGLATLQLGKQERRPPSPPTNAGPASPLHWSQWVAPCRLPGPKRNGLALTGSAIASRVGLPMPVRALGDIGNLVGPFNTRCNVGKEAAAKKAPAQPSQSERAALVCSVPAIPGVLPQPCT